MYTDLASISISWRDFTASCTSTDPVVGLALIESKKPNRWERFGCCQHSLGCNQSMNAAQTAGCYSFIWFYFWNTTNQLYSGWTWPLVKYQLHVYLTINFRSMFWPREAVKNSPIFSSISLTYQMYLEKSTEKHWPFIFFPVRFDFKYLRQSIIYSFSVMTINGLILSSRYPGPSFLWHWAASQGCFASQPGSSDPNTRFRNLLPFQTALSFRVRQLIVQ